jgi:Zn-dependent protease with chaperone function
MSSLAIAPALALALLLAAAPHLLPLHRAAPVTGAVVWMLALLLKALVVLAVATFAFARLAYADPIEAALSWCGHEVLPDIPGRLGFAQHPVAHAAVAVPLFAMAGALVAKAVGGLRASVALRRRLAGAPSFGPQGAAVLPDDEVVVAVTRLGRGRVVVSDRALELMDDDELAAGMAHELAHLHTRHRPLLVLASLLATIARPLPGTAEAHRELSFQLERDADAWAVSRLQDPLSLASAICKVAGAREAPGTASLVGRGAVTRRLAELIGERGSRSQPVELAARVLAMGMVGAVLVLAVAAPAWAQAVSNGHNGQICTHR